MSIFGNLLRRKGQTPEDAAQKQRFDQEWAEAIQRFGIVTGLGTINLGLKHPKTGQEMLPHEGLGQTFSEWKPIQAPYDRHALLFDQIFSTVGRSMNRPQIAHYLVANRRPDKALALLEQAQTSETASAAYHAASARALLSLGRPADALVHAKQAVDLMPDDSRMRTTFADALHMNGQCEEAHALYATLMASAGPVTEDTASVAPMFISLFSQETGAVPSPVLAVDGSGLDVQSGILAEWKMPLKTPLHLVLPVPAHTSGKQAFPASASNASSAETAAARSASNRLTEALTRSAKRKS